MGIMTKELVEWAVQSNLTTKEIAEHFGISKSFAEKIVYGKTAYSTLRRDPPKRAFTPEQVRAIRADTRPQKEVAADYGCATSMISSIKNYWFYFDVPGPQSRPTKKKGPGRKLTKEQVQEMREYTGKKRPLKHWALTYDVSITTVFNALNKIYYEEVS